MDERKIHRRCRVCGACKPLEAFERARPGIWRRVCRGCRSRRRMRRKLEARAEAVPPRYLDPEPQAEQLQRLSEEQVRDNRSHPWGKRS